jgi:hypothetical protein
MEKRGDIGEVHHQMINERGASNLSVRSWNVTSLNAPADANPESGRSFPIWASIAEIRPDLPADKHEGSIPSPAPLITKHSGKVQVKCK